MVIYGANLKLNPIGRIKVSAEAAKSVTQVSIDTGDGLQNDDNNAYLLNVGYASGGIDATVGYQYIDPRYSAPGYWNKIGNWYNPTNVRGPFVRVLYDLTPSLRFHIGGDFLEGARNRTGGDVISGVLLPIGTGLGIGDNVNRVTAGVRWRATKQLAVGADYEGVFWDLQASSSASGVPAKPIEQYLTFDVGLNLNSNTVLKAAYQIIGIKDLSGGFGLGNWNGTVFTTQVAVHF